MSPSGAQLMRRHLNSLTEGLPAPFWALWFGTLVTRAGSFVVPLLFVYLTQARGLSLTAAGAVAGLYGLGSLLGNLLGGVLADRLGRRVTMVASLLAGAGFMVLLSLARDPWQLAASTLLLGVAADAYRPASQALITDLVPPEHRMKAFALQYWAINLGFSFAVPFAGAMARHGFTPLFLGDAATTLVLAAIIVTRVPERRPQPAARSPAGGSLLSPLVDRVFAPFLLLNFAVVLVFFQHLSALPEDMRAKGLGTPEFGLAVATNGVLIVLLQPWLTRATARLRTSTVLALAAAVTGVGFGLTPLASSLPAYMLTVAVWTLGEILFAPVNAALVAERSPAHLRGRYQGAFGMTWSLGWMLAPLVGAGVIEAAGLQTLWLACLAVGLLVALAHLTVSARLLGRPAPS
jgi:MFS family permease